MVSLCLQGDQPEGIETMSQPNRCLRPHGDQRGSSEDRRRRRVWILSPAAPFGGDGVEVDCVHCCVSVNNDTMEIDRIDPNGSYRRDNIQPSCGSCNRERSDNVDWIPPRLRIELALTG